MPVSVEHLSSVIRWHSEDCPKGLSSERAVAVRWIDPHTVELMALGKGETITFRQAHEAKDAIKELGITMLGIKRRGKMHWIKASEIR